MSNIQICDLRFILVQLIKKGGLRERANRSSKYAQSENSIKTLDPHRYHNPPQEIEQQYVESTQTDPSITKSLHEDQHSNHASQD